MAWRRLSIILIGLGFASTAHAIVDANGVPTRRAPLPMLMNKNLGLRLGGVYRPLGSSQAGGSLAFQYQKEYVGFDIRGSYYSTSYGAIRAIAEDSMRQSAQTDGLASATQPDSEINRVRSQDDSWRFWMVEPGISVRGRLFVDRFPRLTEKVRFGLSYGGYTDATNAIAFTGILASLEMGLEYQLSPTVPIAIEGALNYRYGILRRSVPLATENLGQLPVQFWEMSLAFNYWF